MAGKIYAGSAPDDAPANRGWLLGHFMPAGDIRRSDDVEIKWGVHPRGDQRAQWVTGETRTALIILVTRPVPAGVPRAQRAARRARGLRGVPRRRPLLVHGGGIGDRGDQMAVRSRLRPARISLRCG